MILKNKTAIITGGARGMGRAIALRFASEGCSAVIADVLEEDAAKTVEMVKQKGQQAIAVHCDVSNPKSINEMVVKAIAKFGKIDIMVNCAGIGKPPKLINDITEEEYDKVVDINMKGIFFSCQAIAPHMKSNNYGKIVNISSLAGIAPSPFSIHYAAAKAGALLITQDVALELAKYHINVNAILPGMIRTAMTADFAPPMIKDLDAFMGKMAEGIPLKREGTVEDIASAALFLVSEESSYITGDRLCVGGGMPWRGAP
jgi:3-oxoacyl-[acyl-carrier protein] reductase